MRRRVHVAGTGEHSVADLVVLRSTGHGILLSAGSAGNNVVDSVSEHNGGDAVRVQSDRNTLSGVAGNHSADGIEVDGDGNLLYRCSASENSDGFRVRGHRTRLILSHASANSNGFKIDGDRTTLRRSHAFENGSCVFVGHTAQDANLRNNTADRCNVGILFGGGGAITRNTIDDSGYSGGIVVRSEYPTVRIIGNTVTNTSALSKDMVELTAGCAPHVWKHNTFASSNDACIQ